MMDRFSTRRTQQKMERMRHSAVSFSRDVGFFFFFYCRLEDFDLTQIL